MLISDLQKELAALGLLFDIQTIRRRIDFYIETPERNHKNNYRTIGDYEFNRLKIALALEVVGFSQTEVLKLLNNERKKTDVLPYIVNLSKIQEILTQWTKE